MARIVQIIAECSNCSYQGPESEFVMDVEVFIPAFMRKDRMLDLCKERGKDCYAQFRDAMEPWINVSHNSDGTTSPYRKQRKSSKEQVACTQPGCGRVLKNEQGLNMHLTIAHDLPPSKQRHQLTNPHPGNSSKCPECGRDDFANEHGLLMHRVRTHGVQGEARRNRKSKVTVDASRKRGRKTTARV